MISMLDDAEIKLVNIIIKILLVISLLLLIPSMWLFFQRNV